MDTTHPKIRPIHPFGPPVGQWKPGANVAETFRRVVEQQKVPAK